MTSLTITSALMPTTEAEPVRVAVGVIQRDDFILIAKRPAHLHQGGLWEFPGGKIQLGEPAVGALVRELEEEIGIQISSEDPEYLFSVRWDYPDKQVMLEIYLVDKFSGDPEGKEGQPVKWVRPEELGEYQFPEANARILRWILETN